MKGSPFISVPSIGSLIPVALLFVVLLALGGCTKKQAEIDQTGHHNSLPHLLRKNYSFSNLFNGIVIKSSVESASSEYTAIAAAAATNSYELDINLHVLWPKAATSQADLTAATPELPTLLPNLAKLLEGVTPSPDFPALLQRKEKSLRANLSSLQRLPYRDSLFDCQTILNLQNRETGRQALFVQAIMNVNTDGSDGDRNLAIDKLSLTFQPQTNYRWAKTSGHPNPCLRDSESRQALLQAELATGTLAPEEKTKLKKELEIAKATSEELKHWSFLVGTADPFIVLPSFMVGKGAGQPSIGDYAVVIAHGKLYPAVLGDLGPSSKIGEASLRICREIDGKSGAERRPSNRPEIVYLVFPGSAEKPMKSPDYTHWSERCRALWKEFGGSDSAPWHEWTSLEKPWPTPTPMPSPSPTTSPNPSPTQGDSTVQPVAPAAAAAGTTGTNPASPETTTSQNTPPSTSILSPEKTPK